MLKKIFEAPFEFIGWSFKTIYGRVMLIALLTLVALAVNYPVTDTEVDVWKVRDTIAITKDKPKDTDSVGRIDRTTITGREWVQKIETKNGLAHFTLPFHSTAERELNLANTTVAPNGKSMVKERTISRVSRGLTLGLDLQGGTEIRYRIVQPKGEQAYSGSEVIEVIRRRIDSYGLKEPRIQQVGRDSILIQIPGFDASDVAHVKDIITKIGRLEFRLVAHPEKDAAALADATAAKERGEAPPEGWHWYKMTRTDEQTGEEKTSELLIKDQIELTGEGIDRVGITRDQQQGDLGVALDFKDQSAFYEVSSQNVGRQLAIILDDVRNQAGELVQQGTLHSAPVIQEAILGNARISGGFTEKSANDLKNVLQSGSLKAPLEEESTQYVGPYQGRQAIEKGLNSAMYGFLAVVVFMALYYLKAGLVADFALCLNLLLLMAFMASRGATLTLPGIAGIILTAGMAVDANILIFERIREEYEGMKDKPLIKCVRDGHAKALSTIIDSNLTTLITGIILYIFGTGPVKGFAVTLSYGLIISMFTAVVVTKLVFEAFEKMGWLKSLPMLRLIPQNPHIPFMKMRNFFVVTSTIIVIASLIYFFFGPGRRMGIEFSSGTLVEINLAQPAMRDALDSKLEQAGFKDYEVQEIAAKRELGAASRSYAIRLRTVPTVEITELKRIADADATSSAIASVNREVDAVEMESRLTAAGAKSPKVKALEKTGVKFVYEVRSLDLSEQDLAEHIRAVFGSELITSDIKKALDNPETRLASEGIQVVSEEGGRLNMKLNLAAPIQPAALQTLLEERIQGTKVVAEKPLPDGSADQFSVDTRAGSLAEIKDTLKLAKIGTLEPIGSVTTIHPSVARELTVKAVIAVVLALFAIVAYVWFRFEFRFGIAAVLALVHDVSLTLGALALTGREISLTIIAAILTIIGYSLNDTIVIFDRIRENRRIVRKTEFLDIIDSSVNQTLSRSALTSLTTFISTLCLYIWGGPAIEDFAFAMLVGIIVGSYSTVFIASPILLLMGEQGATRGPIGTIAPKPATDEA